MATTRKRDRPDETGPTEANPAKRQKTAEEEQYGNGGLPSSPRAELSAAAVEAELKKQLFNAVLKIQELTSKTTEQAATISQMQHITALLQKTMEQQNTMIDRLTTRNDTLEKEMTALTQRLAAQLVVDTHKAEPSMSTPTAPASTPAVAQPSLPTTATNSVALLKSLMSKGSAPDRKEPPKPSSTTQPTAGQRKPESTPPPSAPSTPTLLTAVLKKALSSRPSEPSPAPAAERKDARSSDPRPSQARTSPRDPRDSTTRDSGSRDSGERKDSRSSSYSPSNPTFSRSTSPALPASSSSSYSTKDDRRSDRKPTTSFSTDRYPPDRNNDRRERESDRYDPSRPSSGRETPLSRYDRNDRTASHPVSTARSTPAGPPAATSRPTKSIDANYLKYLRQHLSVDHVPKLYIQVQSLQVTEEDLAGFLAGCEPFHIRPLGPTIHGTAQGERYQVVFEHRASADKALSLSGASLRNEPVYVLQWKPFTTAALADLVFRPPDAEIKSVYVDTFGSVMKEDPDMVEVIFGTCGAIKEIQFVRQTNLAGVSEFKGQFMLQFEDAKAAEKAVEFDGSLIAHLPVTVRFLHANLIPEGTEAGEVPVPANGPPAGGDLAPVVLD